jgi:hypothetical protein
MQVVFETQQQPDGTRTLAQVAWHCWCIWHNQALRPIRHCAAQPVTQAACVAGRPVQLLQTLMPRRFTTTKKALVHTTPGHFVPPSRPKNSCASNIHLFTKTTPAFAMGCHALGACCAFDALVYTSVQHAPHRAVQLLRCSQLQSQAGVVGTGSWRHEADRLHKRLRRAHNPQQHTWRATHLLVGVTRYVQTLLCFGHEVPSAEALAKAHAEALAAGSSCCCST